MTDRLAKVFAKFFASIKIGDAAQAAAFQHSPDQEKMLTTLPESRSSII